MDDLVKRLRVARDMWLQEREFIYNVHNSLYGQAADAIERLTAERDSALLAYKTSEDDVFNLTQKVIPNLRAERDAMELNWTGSADTCSRLHAYVRKLEAERDALQADAARYRWLRDMDEDPVCSLAAIWTDCKGRALRISKKVDAAVDAARGKNTT